MSDTRSIGNRSALSVTTNPPTVPTATPCCETTAREAAQHDFRVFFLSDGAATKEMNGVPADDLQRATLASLGMVFAQISTVDQLMERIRASAPSSVVSA